jgi:hypothetical protein
MQRTQQTLMAACPASFSSQLNDLGDGKRFNCEVEEHTTYERRLVTQKNLLFSLGGSRITRPRALGGTRGRKRTRVEASEEASEIEKNRERECVRKREEKE